MVENQVQEKSRSFLAILSFWLGLASLVPVFDAMLLAAVPAVILGIIARKRIRLNGGHGSRLARAGIIMGSISIVMVLIFWSLTACCINYGMVPAKWTDYFPLLSALLN